VSVVSQIITWCSKLAGPEAGPEPKGLPVQNHEAILACLDDPKTRQIVIDIERGVMKGVQPEHASFVGEGLFEQMPLELRKTMAGKSLEYSYKSKDWKGKTEFTRLLIGDTMNFFYFQSALDENENVDLIAIWVQGPPSLSLETVVARMIQQGLVGWDSSNERFALAKS